MFCTKQNMRNVFGGQSSCISELDGQPDLCKLNPPAIEIKRRNFCILNFMNYDDIHPGFITGVLTNTKLNFLYY